MTVRPLELAGMYLIEPRVFEDERGWFMETYQDRRFADAGITESFVQDNHSCSHRHVLRGLHFQHKWPQGKLVRVVRGEVFDVAVDLRRSSPTFGQWIGETLSETNRRQLYIPPGCAHGFCVLSSSADFVYKCTAAYAPGDEFTLLWNDPTVGIQWPVDAPILSAKDQAGLRLQDVPTFD